MGWWKTGNNDDVIGDVTADDITTRLKALAKALTEAGEKKPSWPELLAAIGQVIKGSESEYLEAGTETSIAALKDTELESDSTEGGVSPKKEFLKAVQSLVDEIKTAYEQNLERKPRLSEIVANFKFVCSAEPEQYLRLD